MDRVIHLADDFAIMSHGKPSKYDAEKELRSLLDLHPEKASYKKQVRTFLEQFGSRYDYGKEPFEIRACSDAEKLILLKSGFDTYADERSGKIYLFKADDSRKDCFAVCLHGTQSAKNKFDSRYPQQGSVNAIRESLVYIAKLSLFSQGKTDAPPFIKKHHGDYYFDAPFSIFNHVDIPEDEGIHLVGVYNGKITQQPENLCWLTEEIVDNERKLRLRGRFEYANADKEDELAAFLLFLILCENYRGGTQKYYIDPTQLTFELNYNLAEALRDCVMNGRIRACEWCGLPVVGRASFCRGTRCQPNYNERARREIIKNRYGRIDAEKHFPALLNSTLDKWFEA